jgi:hypothetical protein
VAAVSTDRGKRAPQWLAAWLTARGWPHAEATPNGRHGRDILGVPGLAIEVKTSPVWRTDALAQARRNAGEDMPMVFYFPPGVGEARVELGMFVVEPLVMLELLREAGYGDVLRSGGSFTLDDRSARVIEDAKARGVIGR